MPTKDPEKLAEQRRLWNEKRRAARANRPPRAKLSAEELKARKAARRAAYFAANPEKKLEYARRFREKNREKVRATQLESYYRRRILKTPEEKAQNRAQANEKRRQWAEQKYAAIRAEKAAAQEARHKELDARKALAAEKTEAAKRLKEFKAKEAHRKQLGLDRLCEIKHQEPPKPNAEALAIMRARANMKKHGGALSKGWRC